MATHQRKPVQPPHSLAKSVIANYGPGGGKHDKYTDFVVKFRVRIRTSPFSAGDIRAFEQWAVQTTSGLERSRSSPGTPIHESYLKIVFDYSTSLQGDSEEWKFDEDDDPAVFMLVHYEYPFAGPRSGSEGMIIIEECHSPTTFASRTLAHLFLHTKNAPRWVQTVGVSGVSSQFMMEQWWKCVAVETGDDPESDSSTNRWGFNRGYMVHDMYEHTSGTWGIKREKSYNFRGWRGYPLVRRFVPSVCGWQ